MKAGIEPAVEIGALSFEQAGRMYCLISEIASLNADNRSLIDASVAQQQVIEGLQAELGKLRKLVVIARMYFAAMDGKIDGMDQIEFAEKNGLYDEYLSGTPWGEVFERHLKGR